LALWQPEQYWLSGASCGDVAAAQADGANTRSADTVMRTERLGMRSPFSHFTRLKYMASRLFVCTEVRFLFKAA
jgi:hypothetical protein